MSVKFSKLTEFSATTMSNWLKASKAPSDCGRDVGDSRDFGRNGIRSAVPMNYKNVVL
jgi:hypothetical protein